MADPFLAEIRIFGFNFPPQGWAFCNGQLLAISQNTALFALLGTVYGGDGKSTFALPDLQGRAPMHPGQGPGLSDHDLGESEGREFLTLLESEMPAHSHTLAGTEAVSSGNDAAGKVTGRPFGGGALYAPIGGGTPMAPEAVTPVGGGLPHTNMQPTLHVNFCIALQGIFPTRP